MKWFMTAITTLALATPVTAANPHHALALDQVDASHGATVTFTVTTDADSPYLILDCFQNGEWVYAGQGRPGTAFVLAATSWQGGAADCTARLGDLNDDGTRFRRLASASFHVNA